MEAGEDYLEVNRESWNKKVDIHLESDFYEHQEFLNGKNALREIERGLLGDISGKTVLHLQCHFGQDSVSMARMGAKVTGVDLSDKAIDAAKSIAAKLGADAEFICCDVYSLPQLLDKKFDIVFTSYGTIGWLPDLQKWADAIHHFLKPGGRFVFAEFHPVVWMFDSKFSFVEYRYFKTDPIIEVLTGSYAARDADVELKHISWNHALSEVISALLISGLSLETFQEYDYSPYNCFDETLEFEPGKFRIKHLEDKIPMVYSLTAVKS